MNQTRPDIEAAQRERLLAAAQAARRAAQRFAGLALAFALLGLAAALGLTWAMADAWSWPLWAWLTVGALLSLPALVVGKLYLMLLGLIDLPGQLQALAARAGPAGEGGRTIEVEADGEARVVDDGAQPPPSGGFVRLREVVTVGMEAGDTAGTLGDLALLANPVFWLATLLSLLLNALLVGIGAITALVLWIR